eukprot:COSAG01_NODE_558_length_15478_cov_217.596788_8_plen_135_part_00
MATHASQDRSESTLTIKSLTRLIESAVHYLDLFLSSFRWLHSAFAATVGLSKDERDAVKEAEESGCLEWYMSAHFLKARLLGKIDTVQFQTRSLDAYGCLASFSQHAPPGIMSEELAIAAEMAALLPEKITRLA